MWTPSHTWFLEPTAAYNPNGMSIGSAVFSGLTAERPYTLQWAATFPQIAPSHVGIWTPCNIWFFEPTGVHYSNGISVCSVGFAGLTTVTDRLTDRQTDQPTNHAIRYVRIGRMYVHSTAMRPLLAFFPLFVSESVLLTYQGQVRVTNDDILRLTLSLQCTHQCTCPFLHFLLQNTCRTPAKLFLT